MHSKRRTSTFRQSKLVGPSCQAVSVSSRLLDQHRWWYEWQRCYSRNVEQWM